MQGRNRCFVKQGEGKSLGVRMTTEEASNLLGTRGKGGALEMLSPSNWHATVSPGAGVQS